MKKFDVKGAIMKNYEELALATTASAINDYIEGKWWLKHNPEPVEAETETLKKWNNKKTRYENIVATAVLFFNSERFKTFTKNNTSVKDYLFERMDKAIEYPNNKIPYTLKDENGKEKTVMGDVAAIATKALIDNLRDLI
jgi:hypothetical protein